MRQSLASVRIQLGSEVSDVGTNLLGSLASVFDLEAGQVVPDALQSKELVEERAIESKSKHLEPGAARPPHVTFTLAQVSLQSVVVLAHFLLILNVAHLAGSLPPVRGRLHHNGVGLQLLNELLGALGKHGGLVESTNKVNILSIEALGQMQKRRLETSLSTQVFKQ